MFSGLEAHPPRDRALAQNAVATIEEIKFLAVFVSVFIKLPHLVATNACDINKR